MVKRWEKMGRKPILQLDPSKSGNQASTSSSGNGNFRGLIQYEDSDDEADVNGEACDSSAGEGSGGPKKIDLEVADFLKEIDAMTVNEVQGSSEAEAKEDENSIPEVAMNLTNGQAATRSDESHECSWQQCYDESSGYTYFWNIESNQVTWECPEEYRLHLEKVNAPNKVRDGEHPVSSLPPADLQEASTSTGKRYMPKPHRKKGSPKEGKIIPISYFGPSSSSSDEYDCPEPETKKPKLVEDEKPMDLHYGPHLPSETIRPDGPQEDPVASTSSTSEQGIADDNAQPSSSSWKRSDSEVKHDSSINMQPDQGDCTEQITSNPSEIQVDNISDSEVHCNEKESLAVSATIECLPDNSVVVIKHASSCSSSGDEPDSTCYMRRDRSNHASSPASFASPSSSLTQGLQSVLVYGASEDESEFELPTPSQKPPNQSNCHTPLIDLGGNDDSNTSDSQSFFPIALPSSNSERNSPSSNEPVAQDLSSSTSNVSTAAVDAPIVPVMSPKPGPSSPKGSVSPDEEIDLDEIDKELDRALERKMCAESTSHIDSPTPSRNDPPDMIASINEPADSVVIVNQNAEESNNQPLFDDLVSKLELLSGNRSQLPLLAMLLIMLETRHADWQNGALQTEYFERRLHEADSLLKQYETSASPRGWKCNWDRYEITCRGCVRDSKKKHDTKEVLGMVFWGLFLSPVSPSCLKIVHIMCDFTPWSSLKSGFLDYRRLEISELGKQIS